MSGIQLLHKATKSDEYKLKVAQGGRMRGLFGETDLKTRTIRINKKLHARKNGGHLIKNSDGTEKLIGTLTHELMHARHPKMHEKTVRKAARKAVKKMSTPRKWKLYAALRSGSTITV